MSKYLIQASTLSFSHKGQLYMMDKSVHLTFDKVAEALQADDFDKAYALYKSQTFENDTLKIKGNVLTVKGTGVKLGSVYAEAYMYAKSFGDASEAILDKFFENVAKNPDPQSRDGLSEFLALNKMPITDRGTFLAYRYISHDYMDCHTRTMDNMIGNEVRMNREDCDSDPNADCSRGLHVCQHEYMANGGQLHTVVEINPRDVVAVPARYDARKMRVCRMRVLCSLDYFKRELRIAAQAALGAVPVFMTEQTRKWDVTSDIPKEYMDRYNPVDAWEWAAH